MAIGFNSHPAEIERAAIVRFIRAQSNLRQLADMIEAGMHNETRGVLQAYAKKHGVTLRGAQ
jgi:hypothetical protein